MRGLCLAAVWLALSPSHGVAQDYANATNAAWCAGALGAYASKAGATDLDHARSRHLAVAEKFFGTGPDQWSNRSVGAGRRASACR